MPKEAKLKDGVIVSVSGPVVDVYFEDEPPAINEALIVTKTNGEQITLEVEFEIGDKQVKTLAFGSTDGISRGMKVERTGAPISVPVGDKTLGRIFNVLGQTIDGEKFDNKGVSLHPIHADPPLLSDQETKPQILETGVKVIDLI